VSQLELIRKRSSHLLALCVVLLVAGCSTDMAGTTVRRNGLPITFDFTSECAGYTGTEGGATSDCKHGEFRVTVRHPGPNVRPEQDYLFRFDDSAPGLAVSADVRLDRGRVEDQALGVACVGSGYQQPAREYIFAVGGGIAAIFRRDETLVGSKILKQLAYRSVAGMSSSATTHIDGECATLSGGTTLLVMRVNGREVLREYTHTRFPRFVATDLWMFTSSGGAFACDNLSARAESGSSRRSRARGPLD
jgi:hypothetical protein